jgi:hypothetical protein
VFYHEYIQRNFDPKFYGLDEFVLPAHLNWNTFLNILVNGITLPAQINLLPDDSVVSSLTINIRFEYKLQDIWDNIKGIISDKHPNMQLANLTLGGTSKAKKKTLLMHLPYMIIEVSNLTTTPHTRTCSKDAHITKINGDECFYFGLEEIDICIVEKAR